MQAQYVFIHDALSELVQCGETEVLASNLRISINQLERNVTDDPNTTGYQKQFQVCSGYEIEHVSYTVCVHTVNGRAHCVLVSVCPWLFFLQTLEQVSSQTKASYIEAEAEYNICKNRFRDKLPSECTVQPGQCSQCSAARAVCVIPLSVGVCCPFVYVCVCWPLVCVCGVCVYMCGVCVHMCGVCVH